MSKVIVLPNHIASQIAAGEVIERPVSVVKELAENSIDAGSNTIEISVSSNCLDIRVADNGTGMEVDDAILAFHRHATSKLASADDLWSLTTMGFRGEALPSIASVSRLTCYTRTSGSETGIKIECVDGTLSSATTGCAPGTVIEVTDLFYNVPARLQFLKSAATEFGHIQETVQALAVAYPSISFRLLRSGQLVLKTSGAGELLQAIVESGLHRTADNLSAVSFADTRQHLAIYGYVARPTVFRGDRKGILVIVNNRPVRCFLTYKALDYVFSDLIPRGRFPVSVLTITLDPAQVDVNVHPTKKEIKYLNSNDVYTAIQQALVKAVRGATPLVSQLRSQLDAQFDKQPSYARQGIGQLASSSAQQVDQPSFIKMLSYAPASGQYADALAPVQYSDSDAIPVPGVAEAAQVDAPATLPAGWRMLGYLHNTYFLIESADGLELIEQHIAHERTIYERLLAIRDARHNPVEHSQRLIISVPLQLTVLQTQNLQENLELFQRLGFDFDISASSDGHQADSTVASPSTTRDNSITCTEVPIELAHKDYAAVVQQILEDIDATGAAEVSLEIIKSVACQSAIKNGMSLSQSQILQLISQWLASPRNDTCPHGRPIQLSLSMDKLFGMFHPG